MYTLGINAAFHDCSACLVEDGVVIAPAAEERFTRIKHGKRPLPFTVWQLPFHAIGSCLPPVVLEEAAADWFVDAGRSPFMLFVYRVRPDKAERIPAVRHVDGTVCTTALDVLAIGPFLLEKPGVAAAWGTP